MTASLVIECGARERMLLMKVCEPHHLPDLCFLEDLLTGSNAGLYLEKNTCKRETRTLETEQELSLVFLLRQL